LAGFPVNADTLLIARALLAQGLPLTPELLEELQQAISENPGGARSGQAGAAPVPGASAAAAETAAAVKALGLPLSAGILALAGSHFPPLSDLLNGLRAGLRTLLRGRPSAHLAGLAHEALNLVDALFVGWYDEPAALAESLKKAVGGMGRSLESELSRLPARGPVKPDAPLTLMALARLRGELARSSDPQPLLDVIDRFLEGMRQVQFLNAGPESEPVKGQWLRLNLLLQVQPGEAAGLCSQAAAHLRIAYRPDAVPPVIDPAHTRLILQVELSPDQTVQVDLSLADRRIGARFTATTWELAGRAKDKLPSFQQGLERLGYTLHNARFEVSALPCEAEKDGSTAAAGWGSLGTEISLQT
jgi:hypothetical protein